MPVGEKGSVSLSFSCFQGSKEEVILVLSGATFATCEENVTEIKIHTTDPRDGVTERHTAMTEAHLPLLELN